MIEILIANKTPDYLRIETLANTIWREHYTPIIGEAQVVYMLKKYQSSEAILKQLNEGFEYFILNFDKKPVGYIASKEELESLFLSKIYILSDYRGKRIGKKAMVFIEEKAKTLGLKNIRLTVNINNTTAIMAYEKMGFVKVRPLVADIGNGFVMDDFEMLKTVF